MAVTVSTLGTPISGSKLITDADADGTSENDVLAGAATVYNVEVDNSLNAAASFLKLYDAAAPTIGTTAPDYIFRVAASVSRTFVITAGIAFATGLSYACTTAGGTAGTTSPTSNVIVRIVAA